MVKYPTKGWNFVGFWRRQNFARKWSWAKTWSNSEKLSKVSRRVTTTGGQRFRNWCHSSVSVFLWSCYYYMNWFCNPRFHFQIAQRLGVRKRIPENQFSPCIVLTEGISLQDLCYPTLSRVEQLQWNLSISVCYYCWLSQRWHLPCSRILLFKRHVVNLWLASLRSRHLKCRDPLSSLRHEPCKHWRTKVTIMIRSQRWNGQSTQFVPPCVPPPESHWLQCMLVSWRLRQV